MNETKEPLPGAAPEDMRRALTALSHLALREYGAMPLAEMVAIWGRMEPDNDGDVRAVAAVFGEPLPDGYEAPA